MTTLVAENLGKSYGDAVILEGINFQANPGDSIAFMSPSGSGKSTLLSMLGLLLTPISGRVVVDGVDTSTLNDKQLSKLRLENVGFVFQHTQLIGSLRAIENVTVPANFSAQGAKAKAEQAREMLCQLGLEKRLLHY
ncbi:MAG: ATP-binding cassette domain-containing protein, partial [Coriobacteriaceae bacterium]|nr:ATP-binding cassette domain-containing protein [Coriobacteriaceae bacterium]